MTRVAVSRAAIRLGIAWRKDSTSDFRRSSTTNRSTVPVREPVKAPLGGRLVLCTPAARQGLADNTADNKRGSRADNNIQASILENRFQYQSELEGRARTRFQRRAYPRTPTIPTTPVSLISWSFLRSEKLESV